MYDFSYEAYSRLLEQFLCRGYISTSYTQFDTKNTGVLLLRHDIDIDIFSCERLSEIEVETGFHSTWFFQPNNDLYNPLSSQCLNILTNISKYHSLGLHIDPRFAQDVKGLEAFINRSYDFYSNYIPLEKVFSFHRPTKPLKNFEIPGFVNAYNDTFFKEMVYVSDSNRRCFWEQERIWEAMGNGRSTNLLIHPIWWAEASLQPEAILSRLETVGKRMARAALNNNVTCFAEMLKKEVY